MHAPFDSLSIFARLLDDQKGGSFAFEADGLRTLIAYSRNTNVLRTEAETADGRFEVYDFAPRIPAGLSVEAPLEIHRLVGPLAGTPRLRVTHVGLIHAAITIGEILEARTAHFRAWT